MSGFNHETFAVGDIVYMREVLPTFRLDYDHQGHTGVYVNTDTMKDTISFEVLSVHAARPEEVEDTGCAVGLMTRILTAGPLTKNAIYHLDNQYRSGFWFTKEKPATWIGSEPLTV